MSSLVTFPVSSPVEGTISIFDPLDGAVTSGTTNEFGGVSSRFIPSNVVILRLSDVTKAYWLVLFESSLQAEHPILF